MRRRGGTRAAAPERLTAFVVDEWGGDFAEAFAAWKEARRAFVAEHGDRTALGDMLDVIRAEAQTRRAHTLLPPD